MPSRIQIPDEFVTRDLHPFCEFKDLPVRESSKLQLRAECYNVTNTASFYLPDNNFGSSGFGSISSTGNSIPRQMQFGIKYLF